MRIGLVLVLVLAAMGCRKRPPPPPEEAPAPQLPPEVERLNWSSITDAPGSTAEIIQSATVRDQCHVSVRIDRKEIWSTEACLAHRWQLRFLSSDGEVLIVVTPNPPVFDQPPDEVRVGSIFRHGVLFAALTPRLVGYSKPTVQTGGTLSWLGKEDPRVTADGVELRTADRGRLLIRFDGKNLRQPSPADKAQATGH